MAEKRVNGKWVAMPEVNEPYGDRDYRAFSFLGDVRNYSNIVPIGSRRGVPKDASKEFLRDCEQWSGDGHSHGWVAIQELQEYPDYDKKILLNVGTTMLGMDLASETTLREYLGPYFFSELNRLIDDGVERIVFFFDN